MDKLLTDLFTTGLTPGLAMGILQLMIILFVSTALRDLITSTVARLWAYRRLMKNKYFKAGAWVELPTPVGSIRVQVERITTEVVVLRSYEEKKWIHIPIVKFEADTMVLPDAAPEGQ